MSLFLLLCSKYFLLVFSMSSWQKVNIFLWVFHPSVYIWSKVRATQDLDYQLVITIGCIWIDHSYLELSFKLLLCVFCISNMRRMGFSLKFSSLMMLAELLSCRMYFSSSTYPLTGLIHYAEGDPFTLWGGERPISVPEFLRYPVDLENSSYTFTSLHKSSKFLWVLEVLRDRNIVCMLDCTHVGWHLGLDVYIAPLPQCSVVSQLLA